MILKNEYLKLRRVVVMMILFVFSIACGKDNPDNTISTSASFVESTINGETTDNPIMLTGSSNLQYTLTITSGTQWCSLSKLSEVMTKTSNFQSVDFVYTKRNTDPGDRTAQVSVVSSNGDHYELTLTQTAYSSSTIFDREWSEQPTYKKDAKFVYKTYFTTLSNGKLVRSYSICYDLTKKVSQWVAYPLHTCYTTPSVGRTDAWSYDPNNQSPAIPERDQQYVIQSYGTGFARGHQCPSADRYSNIATNEQTFYATNMMPQNSSFNGGIWGSLESKIRSNIVRDTLYVVTGTYFDGKVTSDRKGNQIGLPSNCWKVLLRTKKGNTGKRIQDCTADELIGIGFWFANDSSNKGALKSYATTIAEIEKKTGFTFFHNLAATATTPVKGQNNPSDWNITN
ncbi:MAG: DNA/RNA non-specific endonuclease [Alistipes sp.]